MMKRQLNILLNRLLNLREHYSLINLLLCGLLFIFLLLVPTKNNLINYKLVKSFLGSSRHGNPGIDRLISLDPNFVNSPLEINDVSTPLGQLIHVIFTYNMLELMLIIFILYIIFYKNILIFISKYIPTKFNFIKKIVSNSLNANIKFTNNILSIWLILLLIFKLLNLFFSYELYNNLDDFVSVYIYIKKQSFVLFILTKNKLKLTKTSIIK